MSKFGIPSQEPNETSERIFVPLDFQTVGIKRLLEDPEAGLFLGTGLGKTIIFLSAFYILKRQGIVNKALVVAKRRIIHNVWPKEVIKWGLDLKVVKVHGNEEQRLRALEEDADIYLLTYQGIDWLSRASNVWEKVEYVDEDTGEISTERILKYKAIPKELRTQFDVLCLDESSMVKNWNAARSRRLRTMLKTFDRRHILTASPIPRSMMDVFNQVYCLDMGDALGQFIGKFRNKYWVPGGFKGKEYELREGGEQEIYRDIAPLVLRFPKDVIKLPPLHRIERIVQLPKEARKQYRELEEHFITEVKGKTIVAANAGVATQKLRQMAGGAIYHGVAEYDDAAGKLRRQPWTKVHDAKIDELRELIEELQGEPLLVAYEFDHERQRIQAAFNQPMPHIGGGTSDAEADRLIDAWNRGDLPVLLGHPDSVAHGLNLQESGWNICFFSIGWNLENHSQFIDRVYRQGQEHAVWVYLLIAEDTIDEMIVDVLAEKEATQDRLFKALETSVSEAKIDEQMSLLYQRKRGTISLNAGTPAKSKPKRTKSMAKANKKSTTQAAPKAAPTPRGLADNATVTNVAKAEAGKGVMGNIAAAIPAKGIKVSALVTRLQKSAPGKHERLASGDVGFIKGYIQGGVRQGLFKVA